MEPPRGAHRHRPWPLDLARDGDLEGAGRDDGDRHVHELVDRVRACGDAPVGLEQRETRERDRAEGRHVDGAFQVDGDLGADHFEAAGDLYVEDVAGTHPVLRAGDDAARGRRRRGRQHRSRGNGRRRRRRTRRPLLREP